MKRVAPNGPLTVRPRHTSEAFVAFVAGLIAQQPRRQEIHIIADNLSAHKTERVRQFLRDHPRVHLHYTPTYASWLNQVKLWFAKIERHVIARGIVTSVPDLARKLMRYIRHSNRHPKPIHWTYTTTSHRIRSQYRPHPAHKRGGVHMAFDDGA